MNYRYRGRMASSTPARPGRRPGASGTQEAILIAAGTLFAEHGFQSTTVRAVAGAADVDPALVHHFFGTKEQLFVEAMRLPIDPATFIPPLIDPGLDGLGERLTRAILAIVTQPPAGAAAASPMLGLLRSAATHPEAARMLREFIGAAILDRVAAAIEADRPQLRAALCGSQIVGLLMAREVVGIPALVAADADELAAAYGPVLQHYLTGDLSSVSGLC